MQAFVLVSLVVLDLAVVVTSRVDTGFQEPEAVEQGVCLVGIPVEAELVDPRGAFDPDLGVQAE
ncbi:hypothetical protein [Amycolatopsis sp. 195334CR]|uniref:hypothetical protein n=1 Tax=Amycolatopsis sp. 195334CR TaxID=2814588 RepID=UPI001A8E08BD|nr:hypothetical protein [Amycolatopsis sp. 195334CR]MBN6040038.1 hypothetical protein [Amycolatopsis sp. 195334CR]